MLKEITAQFVQGAARQTMVDEELTLADRHFRLPSTDAAEQLLARAATASVLALILQKAHTPHLAFFSAPSTEDHGERRPISPAAVAFLQNQIAKDELSLLPECLQLIAARGQRLPLTLITALLPVLNTSEKRLWVAELRCAGMRWLAHLNPDWAWVVSDSGDPLTAFENDSGRARINAFAALRQRDPAQARERLMPDFAKSSADERSALLDCFVQGLSDNDEAFLESALDDRSKTVRLSAAALLCRLPHSALSQRCTARARELIQLERGLLRKTLQVRLPDEPDKAAERDSLDAKTALPGLFNAGPKQLHLAQLLALTPPSIWPTHLGLDWHALIVKWREHEYATALCAGLAHAVLRHRDSAALRALIELDDDKTTQPIYQQLIAPNFALLPDHADFLLQRLRSTRTIEVNLLSELPAPWSPTLSAALFEWLRDSARLNELVKDYSHYHYVSLLQLIALRAPAQAQWLLHWPAMEREQASSSQKRALEAIEQFHTTMQQRLDFLAAMEMP